MTHANGPSGNQSAPAVEVYDEADNWLPVVSVYVKPGGTIVVTVERDDA